MRTYPIALILMLVTFLSFQANAAESVQIQFDSLRCAGGTYVKNLIVDYNSGEKATVIQTSYGVATTTLASVQKSVEFPEIYSEVTFINESGEFLLELRIAPDGFTRAYWDKLGAKVDLIHCQYRLSR